MKLLLEILFFFRVRDKWASDLVFKWWEAETERIISNMKLDAKDIKITPLHDK